MRAGRLVQSATPSQVYLSPTDPEVAEFVGRAVVLPGTASGAHARCALGEVVLTEAAEGEVSLMIRPEQVYVDLSHDEGVRGTVDEVSYYGHDCAVQVRLDDEPPRRVSGRLSSREVARGAAGNRTPVLERRSRSSPGAVSDVAFLGPGARTDTSPTGPVRIESRSPLLTESDQQVS